VRELSDSDHASHDMHEGHGSEEHAGRDKHAGHSVAMFRDRFWLSVLLTILVLVWSEMVQGWLGYTAPSFPRVSSRRSWARSSLSTEALPFLRGAIPEL